MKNRCVTASTNRIGIRKIIEAAPEHAAELETIAGKLIDPLPVVRNYIYHPEFLGSFSLKTVLPALVPELSYDDLEIAEGMTASLLLARLLFRPHMIPEADRAALRQDLEAYCERDTWATVKLVERLKEMGAAPRMSNVEY